METVSSILYITFLIVALLVFIGLFVSLFYILGLIVYEIKHGIFGKYENLD